MQPPSVNHPCHTNKNYNAQQKNRELYLADNGRPPLANITGPDKAASASLVVFESENTLPHKISDERSISAAMNPSFSLDPRPILSPMPGLQDQKYELDRYLG